MSKLTLSDIDSGYATPAKLTSNNDAVEEAFENTLSRDGTSPNQMEAHLDMNSNRILNLPSPGAGSDAARWSDVVDGVSVTNVVAPNQAGNLGKPLSTDGSVVVWGTSAINRTAAESQQSFTPTTYAYPPGNWKRGGALGDNSTNDTTAIQTVIDVAVNTNVTQDEALRISASYGKYKVSQITLHGLGITHELGDANLIGNSVTPKNSIVQLKCGHSVIHGLTVAGAQNTNYTCGVHWYTNDINTFYPGRNVIFGLNATSCQIGVVIGGLPSQSVFVSSPAQADGIAQDAPLSECTIVGLRTYDCVRGLYMNQPNAKLTLTNCTITGEDNLWSSYSPRSDTCALTLGPFGELTMLGGSLEQTQQTDGALFWAKGGTLNIIGTTVESVCPAWVQGDAIVRISNLQNWGLNNNSVPFFYVLDSATGNLDISDNFLLRPAAYAGGIPVVKTVASLSTGTFSPNGKFWVNFSNVEFRDVDFRQGSTYNGIVVGCRAHFTNCYMTTYAGTVRTAQYKIDDSGPNLLNSKVDVAAKTISAFPQTTNTTSAGWTFAVSTASDQWGSDTSSLPTIEGVTAQAALHLKAVAGQQVEANTPKFAVAPQRLYLFRCWIKTGASGAAFTIKSRFYDFGGTASSTASVDMYSGVESAFGTTYQPIMLWLQTPKDCTQADILLHVENGGEAYFVNPEVV